MIFAEKIEYFFIKNGCIEQVQWKRVGLKSRPLSVYRGIRLRIYISPPLLNFATFKDFGELIYLIYNIIIFNFIQKGMGLSVLNPPKYIHLLTFLISRFFLLKIFNAYKNFFQKCFQKLFQKLFQINIFVEFFFNLLKNLKKRELPKITHKSR